MMYYDRYDSPMGTLWLTGENGILTGLSFEEKTGSRAVSGEFELVKRWLDDYFRGSPRGIDFSMDPAGTPFQKLIWKLLLEIPFGQTRTYGDLSRSAACQMGKERMSAQAVGQAVGRNPIAIIVPCHRVVGTDGSLTGYASGLDRKEWLLWHEGRKKE